MCSLGKTKKSKKKNKDRVQETMDKKTPSVLDAYAGSQYPGSDVHKLIGTGKECDLCVLETLLPVLNALWQRLWWPILLGTERCVQCHEKRRTLGDGQLAPACARCGKFFDPHSDRDRQKIAERYPWIKDSWSYVTDFLYMPKTTGLEPSAILNGVYSPLIPLAQSHISVFPPCFIF